MKLNIKGWLGTNLIGFVLVFAAGLVVGALTLGGGGDGQPHGAVKNSETAKKATVWTCSMHPQIKQDQPGLCPICGMDLIPLTGDDDDPGPSGVVLSESAKTLAELETAKVTRRVSLASLRLLGRVDAAETAVRNITAWTGGRIDRLRVRETGQRVRSGQIIATLYSPEIFAAHQDLLVAKKQVAAMSQSTPSALDAAKRTLLAARDRLALLGVPQKVIDQLEKADSPARQIAIRTPFAGTILKRVATEGAYVQTGAVLYEVADLSKIWVQLEAYEQDLPGIKVGQKVTIEVDGRAGELYEGVVDFIDPVLNPVTRVARVRVVVDNSDRSLKPGMFVEAEVHGDTAEGALAPLVIPETAPLFTGERSVVFVAKPGAKKPTYLARTVRLGIRGADGYPVISGLAEGEEVVVKGAFVLDADLQIKGGASMMMGPDDRTVDEAAPLAMTAAQRALLAPVVENYLRIQTGLRSDELKDAQSGARALVDAVKKVQFKQKNEATRYFDELRKQLSAHGDMLADATDIETARGAFEPLSRAVIKLLQRLGNPLPNPLQEAFCPMANGSKGASWVQVEQEVFNPYYGAAMLNCGELKNSVAAGAYLAVPSATTPQPSGGREMEHHH